MTGLLGAQAGDLGAVVRPDVPPHIRGERRRRVAVDRDVRADRVDRRLHHVVEVLVDHGHCLRRSSRSSTSSVTLISPPSAALDCALHTHERVELWRTATMSAPLRGDEPAQMLRVDGLTVRFGGLTALDDVSFEVARRRGRRRDRPQRRRQDDAVQRRLRARPPRRRRRHSATPRSPARPHELAGLGIARTLQGLGLFGGLTVLENVMVGRRAPGARRLRVARCSALPRSDRAERAAARRGARRARRARLADVPTAARARLPYADPQAGRARPGARRRPRLLLLDEPAGGLGERRHRRARRADPRAADGPSTLRGAARRAPRRPGHGGLRPRRRARLRPVDRRRHPGRGPRRPARSTRPTWGRGRRRSTRASTDRSLQRGPTACTGSAYGAGCRSLRPDGATSTVPSAGRSSRRARRQRRGQDHAAAHALRPGAGHAPGRIAARRRGPRARSPVEDLVRLGHRARARGPRRRRRADRRREPAARRAVARRRGDARELDRGLRAVRAAGPARATTPATSSPAASGRCSRSAGRWSPGRSLLLLDEPSLGLAPRVIAQIMGLLRDAARPRPGLTVLLAEQNARARCRSPTTASCSPSARSWRPTTPGRPAGRRPASATPTWGSDGPLRLPHRHRPRARRRLRRLRRSRWC